MLKTAAVISMLILPMGALAAQTDYGTANVSAPWLKNENSAAAAGMAGVFSGSSSRVDALQINPASLASLSNQQISFMHNIGFQDQATEHLAYGLSLGEGKGAALAVDYLNFGEVETYSVDGSGLLSQGSSLKPSAMAVTAGYGHAFGNFSLGLSGKYVSEDLGPVKDSAFSADVGAGWRQGSFQISAAALNVFGQLHGANLPGNFRAGAAYNMKISENQAFTAGFNVAAPFADTEATLVGVGGEFNFAGNYTLRAGYKAGFDQTASGVTAGAGLKISSWTLNYAYDTVGDLGASNRLSLRWGF
jgi:hypothetical protein